MTVAIEMFLFTGTICVRNSSFGACSETAR